MHIIIPNVKRVETFWEFESPTILHLQKFRWPFAAEEGGLIIEGDSLFPTGTERVRFPLSSLQLLGATSFSAEKYLRAMIPMVTFLKGKQLQDYDLRLGVAEAQKAVAIVAGFFRQPNAPTGHVISFLVELNLDTGHVLTLGIVGPSVPKQDSQPLLRQVAHSLKQKYFPDSNQNLRLVYTLSNKTLFSGNSLRYLRHPSLPWILTGY